MCKFKPFKTVMKGLSKTLTVVEADFEEIYWHSYSSNVFLFISNNDPIPVCLFFLAVTVLSVIVTIS